MGLVVRLQPSAHGLKRVGPSNFTLAIEVSRHISLSSREQNRYSLAIEASAGGYRLLEEKLSHPPDQKLPTGLELLTATGGLLRYWDPERKKVVSPAWELDASESVLSQSPNLLTSADSFRRQIGSFAYYQVIPSGRDSAVRRPQQLTNATLPGPSGETLFSAIHTLQQKHPHRFELLEDTLRAAFPGFESLRVPAVANGMLYIDWRTTDTNNPLQVHQLSDGTIRFLWLATLLCSPDLPSLVLLDEPEVSLHPKLLELLVGLFREATRYTQLIVATHSDMLLRFLQPDEIIAAGLDEQGAAIFQRGSEMNLESWLADYTLDQIRALGALDIDG